MLTPVPPTECMQAREAASLRLDGELSELESVRLGLHLRDCEDCRVYAREIAAITLELRAAPLEQPRVRTYVPRLKAIRAMRMQVAAAAAVAVVAAVSAASFAIGQVVGGQGATRTVTAAGVSDPAQSVRLDSTEQHLLAMVPRFTALAPKSSARALPL